MSWQGWQDGLWATLEAAWNALFRGGRGKPVKARGLTRLVILDRWRVTVQVRLWTWALMPASRKIGRKRQTSFHIAKIRNIDYTPPWLLTGVLRIDAPGGNDPWRRARRKDGEDLIPPPRPHKIRFSRRQQDQFQVVLFGVDSTPLDGSLDGSET